MTHSVGRQSGAPFVSGPGATNNVTNAFTNSPWTWSAASPTHNMVATSTNINTIKFSSVTDTGTNPIASLNSIIAGPATPATRPLLSVQKNGTDVAQFLASPAFWAGTAAPGQIIAGNYAIGGRFTPTVTSGSTVALNGESYATPAGASSAVHCGVIGYSRMSAAQNLTATVGLVGVQGVCVNSAAGTVTGAAAFLASSASNSGGGTLTNQYGLYVSTLSGATNNYGVFVGGTNHSHLGGTLSIGITNTSARPLSVTKQVVASSGAAGIVLITPTADTGQTASTEVNGFKYDTATRTWAAGAITTQREVLFSAQTVAFASASTISDAATVAITDAPTAGTNATITRAMALWVQAGQARFDGTLKTGGGRIRNVRVALTSPVTIATTDEIVLTKLTTPGAVAVNLPASPESGREYTIQDATGDAGANNITITPAAGNINGAGTLVVATNYQRKVLIYDSSATAQWLAG